MENEDIRQMILALTSLNHSYNLDDYNKWMHGKNDASEKMSLTSAYKLIPQIIDFLEKNM